MPKTSRITQARVQAGMNALACPACEERSGTLFVPVTMKDYAYIQAHATSKEYKVVGTCGHHCKVRMNSSAYLSVKETE